MAVRARRGYKRWLKYRYLKLVRLNDSPEKVAGGLALGVALGILPTFGLGILIALFTAGLFRVNKVSAVVGTFIMNPWTAMFFWAASYLTGSLVMGNNLAETVGLVRTLRTHGDLWESLVGRKLLLPYVVGNLIVTASAAASSYVACRYSIRVYRRVRKARQRRYLPAR